MTRPAFVLDACTLIPIRLATTLLWLAEADLFTPLWTQQILDEVERNLPRVAGMTPRKAAGRVDAMRSGFGAESLVEGYEDLIDSMRCDPKDRHVLAAAVGAEAEAVVTFNLKDFPETSVRPYGVDVIPPEALLLQLLGTAPEVVASTLRAEVSALRRPAQSVSEFLASLTRVAPTFANLAADATTEYGGYSPVPALVETTAEEAAPAFGINSGPTHPMQCALGWWNGLTTGDLDVTRALSANPASFGDYVWARDLLTDMGLASRVLRAVDAPEDLAFIRFVPEPTTTARVFAPFVTPMVFMSLVRMPDDTWRVWGLGRAMPAAADVFSETR